MFLLTYPTVGKLAETVFYVISIATEMLAQRKEGSGTCLSFHIHTQLEFICVDLPSHNF